MEKVCNSCKNHNECQEYLSMSEDQREELSCIKYQPMPIEEYIMFRKEKYSNYMINTEGAKKYLKE